MNVFRMSLKNLLNHKSRFIFLVSSIAILVWLFTYAIFSVNINRIYKSTEINDLPKNIAVIDRSVFLNKEQEVMASFSQVEFTTRNLIPASQGIQVDVITPGILDMGIPVYHDAYSSVFNIDPIKVLYEDEQNSIETIEYPIIIDDITSLKRFQRLDSVGEKMMIFINGDEVVFQVYAVIKETRERLNLIEATKNNGLPEEVNMNAVGYSHGYILEETYEKIIDEKPQYQLMIVNHVDNFDQDEINTLLDDLEIDKTSFPYISGVSIHELYEIRIGKEHRDSLLSNYVVIGIVGLVFLLIVLNNIIYSLNQNTYDVSYLKTLGVHKPSIFKWFMYHWVIQTVVGVITGGLLSIISLIALYGVDLFTFIGVFITQLLIVLGIVSLLIFVVAVPTTLYTVNKKEYISQIDIEG